MRLAESRVVIIWSFEKGDGEEALDSGRNGLGLSKSPLVIGDCWCGVAVARRPWGAAAGC